MCVPGISVSFFKKNKNIFFKLNLFFVVSGLNVRLNSMVFQSVGEPVRCQWVALSLHYLHLVAAGWFLANTACLTHRLRCGRSPDHFKLVAASVWICPAVLVSVSFER